jgi:hypothetical protein
MQRAKDYLNPKHGKRKSSHPSKRQVRVDREEVAQILSEIPESDRPTNRVECPSYRPCPFVGCRYNMFLDIKETGSITMNYDGMEPWQMQNSCLFDVIEQYPEGLPLGMIGQIMNLTRERVRQVEVEALRKLHANEINDNGSQKSEE